MNLPDLVLIGYWRGRGAEGWPDPADFVDPDWDEDERDLVADHLSRGFRGPRLHGVFAMSSLRGNNGALELSDGVFVWPDGLRHYVVDHGVRLPQKFVSRVVMSSEAFETAGRDDSWWRAQAAERERG